MLYSFLKVFAGFCFNLLNLLMLGNLPPLATVCVVVEQERKVLVVVQPTGESVFPGGFVRWREKVEEAAIRECLEETGLRIRLLDVIGHESEFSPRFTKISTLTMIYHAEVIDGELRASVEGQPRWVPEEDLHDTLIRRQNPIYDYFLRYRARHEQAKIAP